MVEREVHGVSSSGKVYFFEDMALVALLEADVLFPNSFDISRDGENLGHAVTLHVNCNDLFAWGCADAEDLRYNEIESLYNAWHEDSKWGVDKWCMHKRNQKPQNPVIKSMKKAGVWTEKEEALPDNTMDAEVQTLLSQTFGSKNG